MFKYHCFLNKFILSFFFFMLTIACSYAKVLPFSIYFYGQQIELEYEEEMLFPYDINIEELALQRAYGQINTRPNHVLLNAIQSRAAELMLNDWLYVQLVRSCSEHIYGGKNPKSELTNYVLLSNSGYDVRLTYRKESVYVNIFIKDVLYEIPLIKENGRQYANISSQRIEKNRGVSMFLLNHRPNPGGRACSFAFNRWPTFCDVSTQRQISFMFKGNLVELDVEYSKQVADLLNTYPLVDEYWYMEAPLSHQLRESLIPQLRALLKGRTIQSSLELLVAFTRS